MLRTKGIQLQLVYLSSHRTTNKTVAVKTRYCSCEEVSRCHTRGDSEESAACGRWSMQVREPTLALIPRVDVTRSSKREYQWPHKKHWYPPIVFSKNIAVLLKLFFNEANFSCELESGNLLFIKRSGHRDNLKSARQIKRCLELRLKCWIKAESIWCRTINDGVGNDFKGKNSLNCAELNFNHGSAPSCT